MSRFSKRRRAAAAELVEEKLLAADAGEIERQAQEFLAGGIFAAGAALLAPQGVNVTIPPVFTVSLDDTAFTVCPPLREVFALLDEPDADFVRTGHRVRCAVGWAVLAYGDNPLAKLKLDFVEPVTASARIVLLAANYKGFLHEAAAGGVLGLTTTERVARIQSLPPTASFDAGLNEVVPIQAGASPGLEKLIEVYGWPQR